MTTKLTPPNVLLAIIITALLALAIGTVIDVAEAEAETYPQFVANDITTGATTVWGDDGTGTPNPPFAYRAMLLHVRAGASGMTFNVWSGRTHPTDLNTTAWGRIMPHRGETQADTTLTLEANEKALFTFTQQFDLIYVSAGGGDLWGE